MAGGQGSYRQAPWSDSRKITPRRSHTRAPSSPGLAGDGTSRLGPARPGLRPVGPGRGGLREGGAGVRCNKNKIKGAFVSRMHSRIQDPLLQTAEQLVDAASIFAVGSYTQIANLLPLVNDIKTEQWDFVVTVAGVFTSATRLNNLKIPEEREEQLMEIVASRLSEWNPDGIAGFEDCKDFFDHTYNALASLKEYKQEPQFLASDAVGAG